MTAERPKPPLPELVRTPAGSFGWLEDRLLHEGWLGRLGAEGTSVLTLLALAADRHGASFYGRQTMADRLGLSRLQIDRALDRLLELGLVAHRPWRRGLVDGVWQLLPVPPRDGRRPPPPPPLRTANPTPIAAILAQLGLSPPDRHVDPADARQR